MNVITLPFYRDRRLMVQNYFSCYVLQSVAGMPYAESVIDEKRKDDNVKRDEMKVEQVIEVNDGRLDLFG